MNSLSFRTGPGEFLGYRWAVPPFPCRTAVLCIDAILVRHGMGFTGPSVLRGLGRLWDIGTKPDETLIRWRSDASSALGSDFQTGSLEPNDVGVI